MFEAKRLMMTGTTCQSLILLPVKLHIFHRVTDVLLSHSSIANPKAALIRWALPILAAIESWRFLSSEIADDRTI
jgi:hypothetical protein